MFSIFGGVHTRHNLNAVRDGPFDIQGGGGWDFSLRQVIFFSLFAQQVIMSKVNCNKFLIFLKKYHIKIRKMLTKATH